mgnify:CR=1 FL=1
MTEKEFYKQIRLALRVAVNRFHEGVYFDTEEESLKLKNQTIRSIFNEYKQLREFLISKRKKRKK